MSNLTHHQALIHIMVTMSAVDRSMGDAELAKMGDAIKTLPVFSDYNTDSLLEDVSACSLILQDEDGLDQIIQNAIVSLPKHLHQTAYALAVEVAAADLHLEQTELRLLQVLRQKMNIDRLACAAIEHGAKVRFQKL
ncbi:MAG: tellurite resistance TerB family protein [Rhizobiaceae bacterium]|nr:tellurite resistance TerB family protein [Rhizobiaceae bacterium]MBL4731678.1 tellurite resistance TerB family protein [Rhizobiaceae bacterium]